MPSYVHPSAFVKGRSYTSVKNIRDVKVHTFLGEYLRTELIGRPYDPDAILHFKHPNGTEFSFLWIMGAEEFYEGAPPAASTVG